MYLCLTYLCFVTSVSVVAMVIKTESPSVKAGLSSKQKLHCQFALDHKGPNITVEWYWQYRGERTRLFSHTSRTGQTQGTGVGLKSLAGGDASYTIPFTKMSSEGTYICSVLVNPLFASLDINLRIEGKEESQTGRRSGYIRMKYQNGKCVYNTIYCVSKIHFDLIEVR